MTTPDPAAHLAQADRLLRIVDGHLERGIFQGGETEFVQILILAAEAHTRLAQAAASLPIVVRAQFGGSAPPAGNPS